MNSPELNNDENMSKSKTTRAWKWGELAVYATVAFTVLNSLLQLLDSVSKGAKSVVDLLSLFPIALVLVWCAIIGASRWILYARKPGSIDPNRSIPRYEDQLRIFARKMLTISGLCLALLVLGFGLHLVLKKRAETNAIAELSIPEDKFGIVVADFADGANFDDSQKGREITRIFITNLEQDLRQTSLADEVVTRHWEEVIRSEEAAEEIGRKVSADLVIWGWIPIGTENALIPSFSLVAPVYAASESATSLFDIQLTGLETVELGKMLSGQTAAIVESVMGFAHLELGELDQAIVNFSEAIAVTEEQGLTNDEFYQREVEKDLATLHVLRGVAYDVKDEVVSAREDFEAAAPMDPRSIAPFIALGNLYYRRSSWAEAEEQYAVAVTKSPGRSEAHYSLANAYLSQGRVSEAISEYETAVVLKPTFVLAYYNLGLAWESLGNCARAQIAYEKVIEIAPDDSLSTQALRRVEGCGQPVTTPTVPIQPTPLPTVQPSWDRYSTITILIMGATLLLCLTGSLAYIAIRTVLSMRRPPWPFEIVISTPETGYPVCILRVHRRRQRFSERTHGLSKFRIRDLRVESIALCEPAGSPPSMIVKVQVRSQDGSVWEADSEQITYAWERGHEYTMNFGDFRLTIRGLH